jgi:hypothetical protein
LPNSIRFSSDNNNSTTQFFCELLIKCNLHACKHSLINFNRDPKKMWVCVQHIYMLCKYVFVLFRILSLVFHYHWVNCCCCCCSCLAHIISHSCTYIVLKYTYLCMKEEQRQRERKGEKSIFVSSCEKYLWKAKSTHIFI